MASELLEELKASEQFECVDGIWFYIGKMGSDVGMHWLARRFYFAWGQQRNRCNDPYHKQYEDYGAKGVRQIWASRDCVNWCLNEYLRRSEQGHVWKRPAISRVGDIGNYEIGNVKLIEQSENCSEVKVTKARRDNCKGLGLSSRRKVVFQNIEDVKDLSVFQSGKEASEFLGSKNRSYVSSLIKRQKTVSLGGKTYSIKWGT